MPDSIDHQVSLREVKDEDIRIFFEQQLDPEANHMAAFTPPDPTDWEAFRRRWGLIRSNPAITSRTILYGNRTAGHVVSYIQLGQTEVGYWLGREFWGRGIATQALEQFLQIVTQRPLYARAAKDNLASLRVLQKCDFVITGEDKAYANARRQVVEEYVLVLE